MLKNREYLFLSLIVISTILPKWIISFIYYDNSIAVNTIFNIKDIQYFPLVISFSDLIFNPSYLDDIVDNKLISFPTYSLLAHSLFFKMFGVYSFVILEFIFQFIFLIILFKIFQKIFQNFYTSILICILIFFLISLLQILNFYEDSIYLRNLFNILDENFGSRLPRPLFTGIIYFYFFYILFDLKENLNKFDVKYFILISFLLSIFLNSFFFYFLNFSIFLLFLIFRHLDKSLIQFLIENKFKILFVISIFILFSSPFFIQFYFGEPDYSERIGVIEVDFDKKIYLLKYYFTNFLRFEFLLVIIVIFLIHRYLNKNQVFTINNFFYFILISIISPIFFIIISPKLISIYHFLSIILFSIILYLIISVGFILVKKIKLRESQIFNLILIILILVFNIHFESLNTQKKKIYLDETQNIQKFLENHDLIGSDDKLFTNDLKIMNLWLINKNKKLVISDGFTNSLKNADIEYNFINNFKYFGVSRLELENILSFGKSESRNEFLMRLFNYRYQANSLYTYSEINNYTENLKQKIILTSPFRVQLQITPEDEKKRILKLFDNIEINETLVSDVIIVNKIKLKNFNIYNKKYDLVYSSEVYDVYKKS